MMGTHEGQPQHRYIYDIIFLDGNAQVYTANCPALSKTIDASHTYSVTTSGEEKGSSRELNQRHTWQDPKEKHARKLRAVWLHFRLPEQRDKHGFGADRGGAPAGAGVHCPV